MIRALRLSNFRGIAELRWNPAPGANIVLAPNDAGKSTLRAAIEWLLCGRAYGLTDERGAGSEALIRNGAGEACVEALLQGADGGVFGVRRRVTPKASALEVQGIAGNATAQAAALWQRLACNRDVASAALQSGRLLAMTPADQQALILSLQQQRWEGPDIAAALGSDGARRALEIVGCAAEAGGTEALDRIERRAREGRAAEKKARDQAATDLAAVPAGHALTAAETAEVQSELADLRERHLAAAQALGAAAGEAGSRASLVRDITATRAEVARLEGLIAPRQALLDGPAPAPPADLAAADEAVRLCAASSAIAEGDRQRWVSALAALSKGADGRCPFCPDVACGVDLSEARAVMEAGLEAAAKRRESCQAAEQQARTALETARTAWEAARRGAEARQATEEALGHLRASQDKERARLDELRRRLATLPEEPPDAEALRQEASDLSAEAAVLERALRDAASAAAAAGRRETLNKRVADAEARCADLEALCAEFGPGGVRMRLLGPVLAHFLRSTDFALFGSSGAHLSFAPDGGLLVEAQGRWPGAVRAPALSHSMTLRVGLALQFAICEAAHWRLMVVDDVESLDFANRNLAVEVLRDASGQGIQAIALVAQPQAALPRDPGIDRLSMWTFAAGAEIVQPLPLAGGGA